MQEKMFKIIKSLNKYDYEDIYELSREPALFDENIYYDLDLKPKNDEECVKICENNLEWFSQVCDELLN